MNKKLLAIAVVASLGIGAGAGFWWGQLQAQHTPAASSGQKERTVLYWYDPMKPDARFDKPGKSPYMDMDLVPRYADEAGQGSTGVKIDPVLTQNTGVKIAEVKKGTLQSKLDVQGSVVFNDQDVAIVQSRTSGIVERVYPLAVGDVVSAGAPLASVRVPEWQAAQNEYLVLRNDQELGNAARSKLRQLGMSVAQIETIERTGRPIEVVTISTPRGGMVASVDVREGMTVSNGQTLARINGLSSVWIEAEVPESAAARVKVGEPISAVLSAWPNQPLAGKVTSIVPEMNKETRTVRVRASVSNKEGQLRPGMYARIYLQDAANQKPSLLIPSDAVIATGMRSIVIVAQDDGRFIPADVKMGREQNGQTEILEGLQAGEKVVVSGQFMIDSEASLRGVLARMSQMNQKVDATTAPAEHSGHEAPPAYETTGEVKKVSSDEIVLAHDPVPALKWPGMTMPFPLANPDVAKGIKPGDKVRFSFIQKGDEWEVQTIKPIEGSAP